MSLTLTTTKASCVFFARVVRLWTSSDLTNSEKSMTIHLILMDNYVSFLNFRL